MKRAIAAIASTIAGLVLLLGFKTGHPPGAGALPAANAASGFSPSAGTGHGRAAGSHTVTGRAEQTPFGTVQVRIAAEGRHITNVTAVQLPNDFSLSQQISAYTGPLLRAEALKAQSAHIDVISGGTYTSQGYAQSLQSALDKLHA
jgi:uncharacterized protein with FMN-binding domain